MTLRYVPIAGTNEKTSSWASAGSDFEDHMKGAGFDRYADDHQFWSRALAGTFFTKSGHQVWTHGGFDVMEYLERWTEAELHRTVVIAHSYGGAVLAYALASSPRLRHHLGAIITVGTPIRRDLDAIWMSARDGSGVFHVCIYGTGLGARIRFFGQRGRFVREMSWADLKYGVKGGHSGMLRNPQYTPQINTALDAVKATWERLKTSPPPPSAGRATQMGPKPR
jgi:pimeloyl-ACP methyl ester carboxylesterase